MRAGAAARGCERRRGEPERARVAAPSTISSSSVRTRRVSKRCAQEGLGRVGRRRSGTRREERLRRRGGVAAQRARARAVGADHVQAGVEHEDAERQRLEHDLDEALLGVELARALGDHAPPVSAE